YGDGDLLYDSGPLPADGPPRDVNLGLDGVRELRLVAVAVEGEEPAYAYVAEPRLLRPILAGTAPNPPGRLALLRATRDQHEQQRRGGALERHGAGEAAVVRRWRAASGQPDGVLGGVLPDGRLVLANQDLAVVLQSAG